MNKYEIIAIDIKEDILNGVYKPNERLPFEKELCNKYDVSKMTVKKALDLLVSEGLIVKRRGIIEDIRKRVIEILSKDEYAEVIPQIKKCVYGNDANKLGALYNFLQKQELEICMK